MKIPVYIIFFFAILARSQLTLSEIDSYWYFSDAPDNIIASSDHFYIPSSYYTMSIDIESGLRINYDMLGVFNYQGSCGMTANAREFCISEYFSDNLLEITFFQGQSKISAASVARISLLDTSDTKFILGFDNAIISAYSDLESDEATVVYDTISNQVVCRPPAGAQTNTLFYYDNLFYNYSCYFSWCSIYVYNCTSGVQSKMPSYYGAVSEFQVYALDGLQIVNYATTSGQFLNVNNTANVSNVGSFSSIFQVNRQKLVTFQNNVFQFFSLQFDEQGNATFVNTDQIPVPYSSTVLNSQCASGPLLVQFSSGLSTGTMIINPITSQISEISSFNSLNQVTLQNQTTVFLFSNSAAYYLYSNGIYSIIPIRISTLYQTPASSNEVWAWIANSCSFFLFSGSAVSLLNVAIETCNNSNPGTISAVVPNGTNFIFALCSENNDLFLYNQNGEVNTIPLPSGIAFLNPVGNQVLILIESNLTLLDCSFSGTNCQIMEIFPLGTTFLKVSETILGINLNFSTYNNVTFLNFFNPTQTNQSIIIQNAAFGNWSVVMGQNSLIEVVIPASNSQKIFNSQGIEVPVSNVSTIFPGANSQVVVCTQQSICSLNKLQIQLAQSHSFFWKFFLSGLISGFILLRAYHKKIDYLEQVAKIGSYFKSG